MSGVLALPRSERWLIVSSVKDYDAISEWQIKVISEDRSKALYEHISHFWKQERPPRDTRMTPRGTVRRISLPKVNANHSLFLPAKVLTAMHEVMPFIYAPIFDSVDIAAITEVAHRHSFSSHYTMFVAVFVYVHMEALVQSRELYSIAELQRLVDSQSLHHRIRWIAQTLEDLCTVWVQRRMRTMSTKKRCGLPALLVLQSRTHLVEQELFVEFGHGTGEHPLCLPSVREKHSEIIRKIRRFLLESSHKLFFDPLSCTAPLFPRLCPGHNVPLKPFFLNERCSRIETANIVATLGSTFFLDERASSPSKNTRKYLTQEQVDYCDEAFRVNDSVLHVTCRDLGREALYVGIDYGEAGPQSFLFAVQRSGAIARLATVEHLGKSPDASILPSLKFSSRHVGIDVVQRIVDGAAQRVHLHASGVAPLEELEEAPLLLVAQAHPRAPYVAGCGIQALAVAHNRQICVIRVCGTKAQFDYTDCYQAVHSPKARESGPRLREAVQERAGDYICLPLIPGLDAQRLEYKVVREMLAYYYFEMIRQGLNKIYLHELDHIVAKHVLRSHEDYYKTKRGCGIAAVFVAQHPSPHCRRGFFFAQRVCGSVVEFSISRCYDENGKLRKPRELVGADDARKRPRDSFGELWNGV